LAQVGVVVALTHQGGQEEVAVDKSLHRLTIFFPLDRMRLLLEAREPVV
jgi:hypothetical protein